jgi:hypothetical protein
VVSLLFEAARLMAAEARGENERALFSQEAINSRYRELDEREARIDDRDKRVTDRETGTWYAIIEPMSARLRRTFASASRWNTTFVRSAKGRERTLTSRSRSPQRTRNPPRVARTLGSGGSHRLARLGYADERT